MSNHVHGNALLECRHVRKNFGALAAIDGVSFELRDGESLGVAGPNGAGKTTLFDVISGLEKITTGQVILNGRDIAGAEPETVSHLGLARTFQLNAAFETMTVKENIEVSAYFGAKHQLVPGLWLDEATNRRVDGVLEFVGLSSRRYVVANRLTVFERKLLMIASALACDPKLILLDEPIGGLNEEETNIVAKLLTSIQNLGVSLIIIEHVMTFLMRITDRILVMHHGAKLFDGSPKELLKNEEVITVYLGERAAERLLSERTAPIGKAS